MIKRFIPSAILLIVTVLIDTAVIPVLLSSRYIMPLSLMAVMSIGMLRGSIHGALSGVVSGLMIDISCGTLGVFLITYVLSGFIIGIIVYIPEAYKSRQITRRKLYILRALISFAILIVFECIIAFSKYYQTALFDWLYVRDMFIRAFIGTAGTILMLLYASRFIIGRRREIGGRAEKKL